MNHTTSENKNEVSRRSFFQLTLGWLAGTFAVVAASAGAVRFLVPNVLYEPSQRFKAGKPDDYPDGSVTFLEDGAGLPRAPGQHVPLPVGDLHAPRLHGQPRRPWLPLPVPRQRV